MMNNEHPTNTGDRHSSPQGISAAAAALLTGFGMHKERRPRRAGCQGGVHDRPLRTLSVRGGEHVVGTLVLALVDSTGHTAATYSELDSTQQSAARQNTAAAAHCLLPMPYTAAQALHNPSGVPLARSALPTSSLFTVASPAVAAPPSMYQFSSAPIPALPAPALGSLDSPFIPSPHRQRLSSKRRSAFQPFDSRPPPPPPHAAVAAALTVPAGAPRTTRLPRACQIPKCGAVLARQELLREHLIHDHLLPLAPDVKTRWDAALGQYTQRAAGRVGQVAPAAAAQWPAAPPPLAAVAALAAAQAPSDDVFCSPSLHDSYTASLSPQPLDILLSPAPPTSRSSSFNGYPSPSPSLLAYLAAAQSPSSGAGYAACSSPPPVASPPTSSGPHNGDPAYGHEAARAELEEQAAVPIDAAVSSSPEHPSSGPDADGVSTGICGADCARCTYRGRRRPPPSSIMHCKDCALSSSSSNFHLCCRCFLDMKARCMQSAQQPFTLLSMVPLLGVVDGSDESVADHVAKHDFTCVYNLYTTHHDTFEAESLDTPLPPRPSPPRPYHTSDMCAELVARVFKVGCIINDLSGCLNYQRWKELQRQLDPNFFDMSVFYHQAAEHEFLSLLFWIRGNILDNDARIGLDFLHASGLPHLQRLRATSDMASTVFDRWQDTIRIKHPERAQIDIHRLDFSILEQLIRALRDERLVSYFKRDCFKEAYEGFTCGPRPQRLFRKLNERMRIVIDDQPEALHELLFDVLSPVCERIQRGSSASLTSFSHVLGGYLSDVLYVGEELRAFWYQRTCRHTMSALSYRILEEYGATDTTMDSSGAASVQLSYHEQELVFLVGDAFDLLCPREPVSSEDSVVLRRVVRTGLGSEGHLWRLLDCLVVVTNGPSEHRCTSSTTVRLLLQLVNLLIYAWRGFDEADLKAALLHCCGRRSFHALSRILTAHVSWNHNKLHMMELMKVLPRRLERLANLSLRSRLMPRTINRLRAAAHPSIVYAIHSAAPQEEPEADEDAESGDGVQSDHPTPETQLELLLWREERRGRGGAGSPSLQIEEIS